MITRHTSYTFLWLWMLPLIGNNFYMSSMLNAQPPPIVKQIILDSKTIMPRDLEKKILQTSLLKKDEVFTTSLLQKSIKLLYLLGWFENIKSYVSHEPAGVKIKYVFTLRKTVDSIHIKGGYDRGFFSILPGRIEKADIMDRVLLEKDRTFSIKKLEKSLENIKKYFKKQGYFQCEVEYQTIEINHSRVKILLKINRGQPTRISQVTFKGNPILDINELRKKIKTKTGKQFKEKLLQKDVVKLRKFYNLKGYMLATVTPNTLEYNPENNTVEVSFHVNPRQKYTMQVNYKIHPWNLDWWFTRKLNKLYIWRWGKPGFEFVPIWEEQYDDERVIEKGIKVIEEKYRDHGYPNVKVTVSSPVTDKKSNSILLKVTIEEGEKYTLGKINILGNKKIPAKKLKKILSIKKTLLKTLHRLTIVKWGIFNYVEKKVDADVKTLENYYKSNGFISVTVKKKIRFRNKKNKIDVDFIIEEGKQTLVKSFNVSGIRCPSIRDQDITTIYKYRIGEPFNPAVINIAEQKVLQLYDSYGYINAIVKTHTNFSHDNSFVDILVDITEKLPIKIGKIVIIGNKKVKDKVIRRELAMKEGKVFSYQLKRRDERKLFDLGLFKEVSFKPTNIASEGSDQNLILNLREKKSQWFDFGSGINYEVGDVETATTLRVFTKYGNRNIGGYGRQFSFSTIMDADDISRFMHDVSLRYKVSYIERWIGNLPYSLRLDLWKDSSKIEGKYDRSSKNLFIVLNKRFDRYGLDTNLLGFHYEDTTLSDIESFNRQSNEPTSTQVKTKNLPESLNFVVHSITFGLSQDFRDHLFYPSKGHFLNLGLEFATSMLGSKTEFTRFHYQNSFYRSVHDIVIAGSLRLGLATELPYHKRFFLGGSNTVRGYDFESIGPRSFSSIPIGGSVMNNYNFEIRIPVSNSINCVVFCDAGNVWTNFSSWQPVSLLYGTGLGIRLKTRIGPIRVDAGYPLNPPETGETPDIHWYFSIGEAF